MKEKLVAIGGVIFAVLLVVNLAAVVYLYRQYTDNINTINQQNWLTKIKLETIEKSSASFKETVDTLATQLKNYDQSIASLEGKVAAAENKVLSAETGSKEVAAKIQSVKLDIENWQKRYGMAWNEIDKLKEKTDQLLTAVETLKKQPATPDTVDLGKIAVESANAASDGTSTDLDTPDVRN
jgi:chromosome segregation ATPase